MSSRDALPTHDKTNSKVFHRALSSVSTTGLSSLAQSYVFFGGKEAESFFYSSNDTDSFNELLMRSFKNGY